MDAKRRSGWFNRLFGGPASAPSTQPRAAAGREGAAAAVAPELAAPSSSARSDPASPGRVVAATPQTAANADAPTPGSFAPERELAALTQALAEGAAHVCVFSAASKPAAAPQGLKQTAIADETGFIGLRLGGGDPGASPSGRTGGYSMRIPDAIEKSASGRVIEVRVLARATAAEARLSCAYSTNEVGNSGWRKLVFGPGWRIERFVYEVPPMKNGNGDFVGLLPAPEGEPEVDVAGFAIAIAPAQEPR